MVGVGQSLTEILKQILQSLQIPYIFPATVFTFATWLLYPGEIEVDDTNQMVIIATITVIFSNLLYAFNGPIIRLAEGYILKDNWLFMVTSKMEESRYRKIEAQIKECEDKIKKTKWLRGRLDLYNLQTNELEEKIQDIIEKWKVRQAQLNEEMQFQFPLSRHKCLPTSLGNTIAAFEDYSWTRYRISAVHLWPRLLPILEKKNFMPLVQDQKATLDFLLNTGLIILVVCFELLLLFGLHQPNWEYLWLCIGLLTLTYFLIYRAAIAAAQDWGVMIRAAFDLYRDDLRRALHLRALPNESLLEERKLWEAVSQFIVYGKAENFKGFVYLRSQQQEET